MNLNVNVNLELCQSHVQLHMHHRLTRYIIIATIYKASHRVQKLMGHGSTPSDPCDSSDFRDPFDPWPIPCSVTQAYLCAKRHVDPSSSLATTDMGRKFGAVPSFFGGGAYELPLSESHRLSDSGNSDDLEWPSTLCTYCRPFKTRFSNMCSSWQDFNWHITSRAVSLR